MKPRYWICSLAVLPAFGGWVGPYLAGRGVISSGVGDIVVGFLSVVLLPLPIAFVIAKATSSRGLFRFGVFIFSLGLEIATYFVTGPIQRSHTIGVAHRLTSSVSSRVIASVAIEIAQKRKQGTLKITEATETAQTGVPKNWNLMVDMSEVPSSLQNKFIFVSLNEATDVMFAVTSSEGYIWTRRKKIGEFESSSVGHDVWVYRATRE